MSKTFKLASLLVAMGLVSIASGTASAGIINFGFSNSGYLSDLSSCGSGCLHVETKGLAQQTGGGEAWSFDGAMEFYQGVSGALGFGAGADLGWSFKDLDGNNNLFGTFTSLLAGDLTDFSRQGTVQYTVLGGSGIFAGAIGSGSSSIETSWYGVLFKELGQMSVVTKSAAVPEPGMATLLLAGFGMVGVMAYRRRRLQSQL